MLIVYVVPFFFLHCSIHLWHISNYGNRQIDDVLLAMYGLHFVAALRPLVNFSNKQEDYFSVNNLLHKIRYTIPYYRAIKMYGYDTIKQ